MIDGAYEDLIIAAGHAPSGDNTQPWRFAVDPAAGRVALLLDEHRDPSPMNAGQRMARIAVGAALENLLRAAEARGWAAELEPDPRPALAAVLLKGDGGAEVEAEGVLRARVTNRRIYDGRPLPVDLLARLVDQTPDLDGVSTHWITDRDHLKAWAAGIGRADAAMFGDASMRGAFLSKVRFDRAPAARVSEGLSLASLELSAADRLALRALSRMPGWLFKLGGAGRAFAAKARRLVASASGLCLLVARDGDEPTDVVVGRAMQRAWLALTAMGLAAQPMMSWLVLENLLAHGGAASLDALGRRRVQELCAGLRALAPEVRDGRPAFLLRFGFAPAPSGRTGRLPVHAVASHDPSARPTVRHGSGPSPLVTSSGADRRRSAP